MKRIIKRIAITILAFLVILNGLVIPNASAVLADENAAQEMATVEEAMETTAAAEETVVASFVEEGLVYQEETQVISNVPEVEPSGETYVEEITGSVTGGTSGSLDPQQEESGSDQSALSDLGELQALLEQLEAMGALSEETDP